MKRKLLVIVMAASVVICGGIVVAAGASETSKTVSEESTATSIEEYEMYLVDGYPDLCVYSVRPNKTLLLIGNSDMANYETYANVNTDEITGTPIMLAEDFSAVVIENDEGKFIVTTAEGEGAYPDGAPTITPFDESDDSIEWSELYF